jgi:hypothetical protein
MIKDIVQYYLDTTKSDLIKNYKRMGLRASGKFERGLEVSVKDSGSSIHAEILSESHAYFMQQGRGSNKEQTAKQARSLGKILEQWVKDKGIDVNPYAAAWKIVRQGINVPNQHNKGGVITDVINDEWDRELDRRISTWYIKVLQEDIIKMFN